MAASKVNLKLLIDTKSHKVLFAEAGKDFVDFLFNILSMPVGTVIRLLAKNLTVGSLQNIYQSIENLDETYMQPERKKDSILNPIGPTWDPLLLLNDVPARKYYNCKNCSSITDNPSTICPKCRCNMDVATTFVSGPAVNASSSDGGGGGGYVKGVVTYMVMDDLSVTPMSTISCITLLNRFNVREVGDLEERVVNIDMAEGLKLLKASLESRNALTSVFLGKTGA